MANLKRILSAKVAPMRPLTMGKSQSCDHHLIPRSCDMEILLFISAR
jgi:hypothetical protein